MDNAELFAAVAQLSKDIQVREKSDRTAVTLPAQVLHSVMLRLRDQDNLKFDMLCCATAIDWLKNGKIELVYHLYSTVHHHYLQVGVLLDRDAAVAPSLCA